jgi:hypothetical protein
MRIWTAIGRGKIFGCSLSMHLLSRLSFQTRKTISQRKNGREFPKVGRG